MSFKSKPLFIYIKIHKQDDACDTRKIKEPKKFELYKFVTKAIKIPKIKSKKLSILILKFFLQKQTQLLTIKIQLNNTYFFFF